MRAAEFLAGGPAALIEVTDRFEAPRRAKTDAWMLVSPTTTLGTIGGGRLEQLAIARARKALDEQHDTTMDVPLGPEIGQCCGGRGRASHQPRHKRRRGAGSRRAVARWPHALVFGHGHVGKALMPLLDPLSAPRALDRNAGRVRGRKHRAHPPCPSRRSTPAPPGSAFVVVTHDHARSTTCLVDRILAREDAAYLGLIGSATKRATFASRFAKDGHPPERFERVTCPIGRLGGAIASNDKRPEVIATFVAAEVAAALLQ